ncbi:MAG: NAD(P)/FAD-dependent oxidoreductase [Candidatus Parcubacteria bacterium]|nr:NAD(P)/FAD-dependent oxidoreductase [Candidatus Parcubacteria bacterium]
MAAGAGRQAALVMAKEDKFDVAVIGAGPAGMMAAGTAAESGAKVILIEKNKQLGKKLLLTGNGRCNITNAEFNLKELVKNYNNGEFLFHSFSVFGPKEIMDFFAKIGIKTKTERGKRVFPINDDAEEVLEALNRYLTGNPSTSSGQGSVNILFNSEVVSVETANNAAGRRKISKIILRGREITAEKYIFCTGGKSYPLTGSDGSGYKLSEDLGHTVIKPMPALSSIRLKEKWVENLQGISLRDIKISVFSPEAGQKGKRQFSESGDLLFTHSGISGPAALDISAKVGDLLEKSGIKIYLDLLPLLNHEKLEGNLDDILKRYPKKTVKNILSDFVPERLAEVLSGIAGVDKNKIANNMSKQEKRMLIKAFKSLEVTAASILGFDEAKVTRGGISLKEIDHKTMKSKIIDNLFFAGEIIDVDGKTGGFNLQMCWSTGYIAGEAIALADSLR